MRNFTAFVVCSVVSVEVDPVAVFGAVLPQRPVSGGRPLVVWIPKIVQNVMQFEKLEVIGRSIPMKDLEKFLGAEDMPTDVQAIHLLGRILEPQNSDDKARHQNVYKALTQSATRYAVRNLIMHFARLMIEWPDKTRTHNQLEKWKAQCRPKEIQVFDGEQSNKIFKYWCIPHVFPQLLNKRQALLPYELTGIRWDLRSLWIRKDIAQMPEAAAKQQLLEDIAEWSVEPNFNAVGRDARQNLKIATVFAEILAIDDIEVIEIKPTTKTTRRRNFEVKKLPGKSVEDLAEVVLNAAAKIDAFEGFEGIPGKVTRHNISRFYLAIKKMVEE